ncbi:uncharacterized protein LY79DRAFT_370958 [Colletotrichum navitas]|uniref:Uncharacterized protein n=1 Tax=Colletotrichum navitas TaxID=681940 RepID=A0AAD8PQ75_9PEZI|nr:uncharacterized protein LY79DRAFT_370958 [Colletotrichum navitas]KAK1574232.1 hypothetical protein LY79DRAFT_370958 [Colletotrichum navitas]
MYVKRIRPGEEGGRNADERHRPYFPQTLPRWVSNDVTTTCSPRCSSHQPPHSSPCTCATIQPDAAPAFPPILNFREGGKISNSHAISSSSSSPRKPPRDRQDVSSNSQEGPEPLWVSQVKKETFPNSEQTNPQPPRASPSPPPAPCGPAPPQQREPPCGRRSWFDFRPICVAIRNLTAPSPPSADLCQHVSPQDNQVQCL